MTEEWPVVETLIRESSEAALATLEQGHPYVSAVGYVLADEMPLTLAVLLSRLARHTRNLEKNPAVSLLIQEEDKTVPVHERMRASLMGEAVPVQAKDRLLDLKERYVTRFPNSEIFFSLPDFLFYVVQPREIHWIGGFGRAHTFRLASGQWE